MKISFCSIALRKEACSLLDIISRVSALGYDGLEIWGNHLKRELLPEIKDALVQHRLPVSMLSPYFDFTGSEADRQRSLVHAKEVIDFAAYLESPLVRVFTGVIGSTRATPEMKRACVNALRETAKIAGSVGVTLALETHPSTLTDNTEAAVELLAAVDSPDVRLNLDIYHFWEVHGDALMVLDKLFPYVVHVHAKNARLDTEERSIQPHPFLHDRQAQQDFEGICFLEDGLMEYKPFLSSLAKRDFDGYISVEWFGPDVWMAAENELAFLRRELPSRQTSTVSPGRITPLNPPPH